MIEPLKEEEERGGGGLENRKHEERSPDYNSDVFVEPGQSGFHVLQRACGTDHQIEAGQTAQLGVGADHVRGHASCHPAVGQGRPRSGRDQWAHGPAGQGLVSRGPQVARGVPDERGTLLLLRVLLRVQPSATGGSRAREQERGRVQQQVWHVSAGLQAQEVEERGVGEGEG